MPTRFHAGTSLLLAMAAALLAQTAISAAVMAQSPGTDAGSAKPAIKVSPVILAEPEVETSLSVQVGPETAIPRQTFLRVRGLPLAARLSDGHVVTPGVWAVPLSALPTLKLHAPLASSGRSEIHLALVGVDGGVMAETKSSLVVAPAWLLGNTGQRQDLTRNVPPPRLEATAPSAPASPPPSPLAPAVVSAPAPVPPPQPQPATRPEPPPQAAPQVAALPPPATARPAPPKADPIAPPPVARTTPPPLSAPAAQPVPETATKSAPILAPADRERAEAMVQRGDTFWRQGNYAAARQFFRRAADMGLAAGALRMGATYDPSELAGLAVVGLVPEPKEASMWYERARELGAPEATSRLSRLQGR